MTIDRDDLRETAELCKGDPYAHIADAETVLTLLDSLDAAEHRSTRAEARADIRGRAVVMYRERAREAEAERDYWKRENAELRDELVATQEHGATMAHGRDDALHETAEAEARIKAVRAIHRDLYESMSGVPYCDECDRAWPCPTIRALDVSVTSPDAG